jgi:hypothetical protein
VNYTGFDGLNCVLTLSAREFKVLYESLICVSEDSHKRVSALMRASGFSHTPDDVKSIIRQMVLVMQPLGTAISSQVQEQSDDNKPETAQPKLLAN